MRRLAAVLVLLGCAGTAAAEEAEVDVEICLAADGSGSITSEEFAFQRRGYAAAVADRRVIDAIGQGLRGRIALAHMEWGGPDSMHKIVEWRAVSDEASARTFGEALVAAPRVARGWNSISNAILFCKAWIESNAFSAARKVIDVSGDAGQRGGVPLEVARGQALNAGITINGLALHFRGGGMTGPLGQPLEQHFREDLIGGPGAFVLAVQEQAQFIEALVNKLVLEIAGGPAQQKAAGVTR
ncbi:MAG: DUF1194 domain-containing protein [Parvibaculaceae bacterium]